MDILPFPGEHGSLCRQTPSLQTYPPSSSFTPAFTVQCDSHMVWNDLLVCLGQLFSLCSLLTSWASLACSLAGWYEIKSPWFCVNTVLQQLKTSLCYQHYFHYKSKALQRTSHYELKITLSRPKPWPLCKTLQSQLSRHMEKYTERQRFALSLSSLFLDSVCLLGRWTDGLDL